MKSEFYLEIARTGDCRQPRWVVGRLS